jgi:hypothetical protein
MTRTMICQRCGIEGEIEMQGINSDNPAVRLFRHLGHNPFSGRMHYQCPACKIVLFVDPMTVLEDLISEYSRVDTIDAGVAMMAELPHGEPLVQRLVQNQPTGSS